MSQSYVEQKIRDALQLHHGNAGRSRAQLMEWAKSDVVLLHGLTRPHLDGIISYQIDRVLSGRAAPAERSKPAPAAQPVEEDFGMELLRAVAASEVTVFGQERTSRPTSKRPVSQSHIDAINAIASPLRTVKKT